MRRETEKMEQNRTTSYGNSSELQKQEVDSRVQALRRRLTRSKKGEEQVLVPEHETFPGETSNHGADIISPPRYILCTIIVSGMLLRVYYAVSLFSVLHADEFYQVKSQEHSGNWTPNT